jgi:alpha-1,2-mannosyltransferase
MRYLLRVLYIFLVLALAVEVLRDIFRLGDFVGYVEAGRLVLEGKNIYSNYLNTWPPVFSVCAVILTKMDDLSPVLNRLVWLLGGVVAMFLCVQIYFRIFQQKNLPFPTLKNAWQCSETWVLVPLLLIFRYVLDNLSNLQINFFILLLSCLALQFFVEKKDHRAGFFLALAIALKVYPIVLLVYFFWKREWRIIGWTISFWLIINALCFPVLGIRESLDYFSHWYSHIATVPPVAHHTNQSFFGMGQRLLTTSPTEMDFRVNFLDLDKNTAKYMSGLLAIIMAVLPGFFFRHKLEDRRSPAALLEYAFVFAAIPVISPLAWKAYFIFLWIPMAYLWFLIFENPPAFSQKVHRNLKIMFWAGTGLTVFSTELFVGPWFSDVLEVYSCVTLGTLIFLVLILYLRVRTA